MFVCVCVCQREIGKSVCLQLRVRERFGVGNVIFELRLPQSGLWLVYPPPPSVTTVLHTLFLALSRSHTHTHTHTNIFASTQVETKIFDVIFVLIVLDVA